MLILGISCLYHDSAAALVRDGEIVAAAQEERFTRRKHDAAFPRNAIDACLRIAGASARDIDIAVFYEQPRLKADRLIRTFLATAPRSYRAFAEAVPSFLSKYNIEAMARRELGSSFRGRFLCVEHHQSHAASAFFPSPFEESAILTVDGVGEWATTTIGYGSGNRVRIHSELRFPHSVGMLYSAFTSYAGFRVNSGEYKLMGLAPYGEPKYVETIYEHLVELSADGAIWLNQDYFDYMTGDSMTSDRFHRLFGGPPREPETLITQKEMDLAASVQVVTEDILLRLAAQAHAVTGSRNLCMAGGVALNCVANGRILREGPFSGFWIQPAAGDAGGAIGAALHAWFQTLNNDRVPDPDDSMHGALLGPETTDAEAEAVIRQNGCRARKLSDEELAHRVAELIDEGKVVGWARGRMEFGPRALGCRSILGDARRPDMQRQMNLKIKFRESFRPFAPCVLRERVSDYFGLAGDSPYMLIVAPVVEKRRVHAARNEAPAWGIDSLNATRSDVPAITHVDYSARIQTVDARRHGLFRRMMEIFYLRTGCPVIINTSFNVRGEPIVCTAAEAYACFVNTGIDAVVLGNYLVEKSDETVASDPAEYLSRFALD